MNENKESIHDQLIQAYLDYFKANEWWERKNSVRAYWAVQKQTRLIKKLSKARNDELRHQYQAIDPEKRIRKVKKNK